MNVPPASTAELSTAGLRESCAAAAASYRQQHDHLPAAGYVIFWDGRPCGWTASVQEPPRGWDAGCLAVPADPAAPLCVARGGTYLTGATRWEALAQ